MRKHSPCVAVQIMLSYDVLPCFATSIQVEGGANVQNRLMRQSVGRHGSRLLRQLSSGAANISSNDGMARAKAHQLHAPT